MKRVLAMGILGIAVGCHGKASDTSAAGAQTERSGDAADALWDLAPDGTTFGIVATPHAVATADHGLTALRALAALPDFPMGAPALDEIAKAAFGDAKGTPAAAGISLDKGLAIFVAGKDTVAILPVGDRAKFVAAQHGTTDKDTDHFGESTCKQLPQGYACSDTPALLDRIGKQTPSLRGRAKAAGARGDVEGFMAKDMVKGFLTADSFITADVDDGVVSLHGFVPLPPTGPLAVLTKASAPHPDLAGVSSFAAIDIGPLLSTLPSEPRVFGLSPADLGKSLKGPITLTAAAGTMAVTMTAPLADPAPLTTLLGHCGELTGALPGMTATPTAHGCALATTLPIAASVDATVDGTTLRVEMHAGPAATGAKPDVATAFAKELATGDWSYTLWGRGTVLAPSPVPMSAFTANAPPGATNAMVRALMLFSELGLGFKYGDDGIHFRALARTAYANPPEVVAKILAVSSADVLAGKGDEQGKAIADASPSSPFAGDHAAGPSGLMVPMAFAGMASAVAIPAFMDYMKKSKVSEAELQLNKLGKNAKIFYITNAAFPVGDQPLTPAKTCCGPPDYKCPANAADWKTPTWQTLDFEIDEPHLFQYGYHSDGKTADITAVGDLDCDTVMITYTMHLESEGGNVTSHLTRPAPNSD